MKEYTLGEWLRIWLKHYVEPSGLAVHTKMCYNRAVQAVPAELSLVDMKFLSPLDCLLWIQDVARVYLPAVTLHGLRHSVASAAVLSGVPVKSVQGWLGHASYAITADLYANHLPDVSSACERLF